VARNQLNCRGSRPHSRITHQERVVSLTPRILFNTVNSHFWTGLSISLPCFKKGVEQIWLCVHASRNCIDFEEPNVSMQPVLVRTLSCTNFFTLEVPAEKGLSAASAAVVGLILLSQTMPHTMSLLTLRITCLDRSRWRYRCTIVGIRSL